MNAYELQKYFDCKDGELYWKETKASNAIAGQKAGYKRPDGYTRIFIENKAYLAHRIIFAMHHDYLPTQVDHINGDKSDNRIENLRPATHGQNQHNVGLRIDNKSGIKGVSWSKSNKKWKVSLYVNGKNMYFGHYFDIDYAKFVADAMRHKYHKEFANHG